MPDKIETFDQAKDHLAANLFPGSKKETKPGNDNPTQKPEDKPGEQKPDAKDQPVQKPGDKPGETASDKPTDKPNEQVTQKPKRVRKSVVDKSAEALTKAADAITSAAKAITKPAAAEPDRPAAKPEDEVPEARRDDLAVFAELEAMDPKYKGKKAEYVAFAKKEDAYIKAWEREHPGEKFDPEADDHSEFYDANEPEVSARDLRRAEIRLEAKPLAERLADEKTKGLSQKLEEFEVADRIRGTAPKIEQNTAIALSGVLEAMDPEVLKLVNEKGHDEMAKLYPEAGIVMHEIAPHLIGVVDAAVKVFETDGKAYDNRNPFHHEVVDTALDLEKQLSTFDVEQLTKPDGTTFVPRSQWNKMSAEERKKHWVVGSQEVNLALTQKYSNRAKDEYAKRVKDVETAAKARGWTKNNPSQKADEKPSSQKGGDDQEPGETDTDNGKPRSPSTGSATVHRPGETTPGKPKEKPLDFMGKGMFGR